MVFMSFVAHWGVCMACFLEAGCQDSSREGKCAHGVLEKIWSRSLKGAQNMVNLAQTRPVWDCQDGLPPQTDPPGTTPGLISSPMAVPRVVSGW